MDFATAFESIMYDPQSYMRLKKWKEGVIIYAQHPTDKSKMTHPYLCVRSENGFVPWIPTQVELFSQDWEIVE